MEWDLSTYFVPGTIPSGSSPQIIQSSQQTPDKHYSPHFTWGGAREEKAKELVKVAQLITNN